MDKRERKYRQTRYRRELERFLNRLVNFCRSGERTERFESYFARIRRRLEETEKIELYGDYFERLERFVQTAQRLAGSEESCESRCEAILREANLIRKSRRMRSYNRKEKRERDEDF